MIDNVFDRFFDSLSVARISDVTLGTETHNGAILKAAHIHIIGLRDAYLASKNKPISETVIPEVFRGDLLSNIEAYAK